jgi:hypothetical protein
MNTLGWGPHGWDMMFLMAIDAFSRNDPDTNKLMFLQYKDVYINFYTSMSARVFPCVHCRNAWTAFNNPENRQCINGCWGSILSFFLEIFPYKEENKEDNVLVLWLYIMKNKVTQKLTVQEDAKMREEITNYFATHKEDISRSNDMTFIATLEESINREKNIKRIDRNKVTYKDILKKYKLKYQREAHKANYFPYLFAIAFNSGWSDENGTSIRRIRIATICNDYMAFFNCLSLLAPTEKLRISLQNLPCNVAFTVPENKELSISKNTPDDNRLAYWLFNVFMSAKIIDNAKLLPEKFADVITRYTRWRVVCTKSDSSLQTCRSKTPNRNAPLLSDEEYDRIEQYNKPIKGASLAAAFDKIKNLF